MMYEAAIKGAAIAKKRIDSVGTSPSKRSARAAAHAATTIAASRSNDGATRTSSRALERIRLRTFPPKPRKFDRASAEGQGSPMESIVREPT